MKRKILLTLIAICCLLQPLAMASPNGEQTPPESPVTQIGDRTEPDYLTLTATSNNTVIGLQVNGSPNLSTLQYSYDGVNWTNITGTITFNTLSNGQCVKFRSNKQVSSGYSYYINFTCTAGNFSASGNINTLIKYSDVDNVKLSDYAFCKLFYNCSNLVDISGLHMPAMTVARCCCYQMFYGCTGLTSIPSNLLPAMTLGINCYYEMFYGCTGLTSLPSNLLPAITLAGRCYEQMFYGCTGLTSLPLGLLPATTLAGYCYNEMFYGCTGLTTIPTNLLPETILTDNCYEAMFYGCSSLVTATALPAITLASNCYSKMFYNCASLETAPILNATTLAYRCYAEMFSGCSSLVAAPELPATTLAGECYHYMFSGCTSLTMAPELKAEILDGACYAYMFNNCSSLETAPELPATTLAYRCYAGMFSGCSSLKTAPELPVTTLAESCYSGMFGRCSSLITAPALPAKTLAESCYSGMFSGCSSLTTAPALPATTLAVNCYNSMFNGCSSLTTAPALPATTLSDNCYSSMFVECSSLVTAPALPATTLSDNCYYCMFAACSSLETAPTILPATTLTENCYAGMFRYCSSLKTAPELPATNLAESCYSGMFYCCTSLTTAPEILPATTLAKSCYEEMFYECSSLKTAPTIMAVNLATRCCFYMFMRCFSLVTAPTLPAETMAQGCYGYMFAVCTSLTTAPELPATTLAPACYGAMFLSCSSLTVAPTLPATTLVSSCYKDMFENCSSLKSVVTYATTWSSSYASSWLDKVPASGNFFNLGGAKIPVGSSGIPVGWTEYNTDPVRIMASANNTSFGTVSGAGLYVTGDDCTLTATPKYGCTFINWTENNEIVSTDAKYSFTVDVDRNLVANFDMPDNVCIFSGYGSWTTPSNWIGKDGQPLAELPDFTDKDVAIDGMAYIPDGAAPIVKSLTINVSKVLEINDGASLTVSGAISNSNANQLIINDGGQIFQTNNDVKATFKKNIVNPEVWGGSLTGWQFIASPITDAPISGFEPSSGDYDLFAWDVSKGDNPWVNRKAHLNDANYPYFYSNFTQGRGYLASYETQDVASFEGCLNNASTFDFIAKGLVDYSTVHWGNLYLVGNPFTFDVNWSDFDRTNVYDGYAVMNANGSIGYADNSTPIKVGQGFMVITTSDEPLTFKYPKTSKVDESDYKSINIIASNSGGSCNAILHFDGSENGGFPMVDNINDEVATIYTVGSGNKYGIRSCDSDVNEIPLCFEAKEIGYNTISMKLNGDFDYVHLIDRQTGCDTDMLNGNEYKFIAATDDNANRFIVKLSSDNGANSNNNFAYQSGNQLFINGEGFVQVFDVLGRTVISENLNGNSIDISRLENASYIVRLVNQNEVKTQKIVVL